MSIRILIADDHGVVRDGLKALLETQEDMEVVGTVATGHQAIRNTIDLQPDIVLMDIAMPEVNGIDATREIIANLPAMKVIMLSMYSSKDYITKTLEAGAVGYVLKESAGKDVVKAIHAVLSGHRYLSPKITDNALEDYLQLLKEGQTKGVLDTLSLREREVLQLVVEGKTSAQIGDILCISPKSVETYRSRLMKKLKVKDVPSLVKLAIKGGLIKIE